MSNQIELTTAVKVDGNNDEYYVVSPNLDVTINLSEVTFVVFHPEEGSDKGTLIIKKKGEAKQKSGNPEELFLEELKRAEDRFSDGYINYRYFIGHWKSYSLPRGAEDRLRIADRLLADGRIEIYTTADGKEAVRTRITGSDQ